MDVNYDPNVFILLMVIPIGILIGIFMWLGLKAIMILISEKEKSVLITFVCQSCDLEVHAHIDKKAKLIFSIVGKLYSPNDVLSSLGYYICIECRERNNIRFKEMK